MSTFASPEAKVEALRKGMAAGVGHSTNRSALPRSLLVLSVLRPAQVQSDPRFCRYLLESFSPFILFSKNEQMHVAHPKHRVALRVDKVARSCMHACLRFSSQQSSPPSLSDRRDLFLLCSI